MAKQEQLRRNQDPSESAESEVESAEVIELEKVVNQINPTILNSVPKGKKRELLMIVSRFAMKKHSGPLPSPETFQGYEEVLPGSAERIVVMAEKQQEHRMELESKHLKEQLFQSKLGQIFGLIIALFAISAGAYLTMNDHDYVGGLLVSGTLVSLVTIFVLGKRSQKE